jgi:hypothetical protein
VKILFALQGEPILIRRLWLFAALGLVALAAGMIGGVMYRELRTNGGRMSLAAVWRAFVNARSELAATIGLLLLAAVIALGAAGVRVGPAQ